VLGLPLTTFSPAAAWYFVLLVVVFSPGWAKKPGALWATDIENGGQATVLFVLAECIVADEAGRCEWWRSLRVCLILLS
jgi:hypothetical protein